MSRLFFIFFFVWAPLVSLNAAFHLAEKFKAADPGDYVVTLQDNTCCLLLLKSVNLDQLLLEEISIPLELVCLKSMNWRQWLEQKAPGHTTWTLYEIDLKRQELIECFSYSKNGWVYFDQQEQLFSKLFCLPFESVLVDQRKKIGPPPIEGEDYRKIWNPPVIVDGKKKSPPHCDAYKVCWPQDGSVLSLCNVELYFDTDRPSFPFPYWIEIKSPHYTFKIRTIESGKGLSSPLLSRMPYRPPELIGPTLKTDTLWSLPLHAARYHEDIHLFALDLTSHEKICIPHRFERKEQTPSVTVYVKTQDLKKVLHPDHRYQWVIMADKNPTLLVKSEEIFAGLK